MVVGVDCLVCMACKPEVSTNLWCRKGMPPRATSCREGRRVGIDLWLSNTMEWPCFLARDVECAEQASRGLDPIGRAAVLDLFGRCRLRICMSMLDVKTVYWCVLHNRLKSIAREICSHLTIGSRPSPASSAANRYPATRYSHRRQEYKMTRSCPGVEKLCTWKYI